MSTIAAYSLIKFNMDHFDDDSPEWGESLPVPAFIRRLMPGASEEELQEATENWLAYMGVIWRIHERLRADGERDDSKPPNGRKFDSCLV